MPAPYGNVLDRLHEAGGHTVSVGKIADIFGRRHTGDVITGENDADLFEKMLLATPRLPERGLLFANFVDLDTDFGHRRDVAGYAAGIERLDPLIERMVALMAPGDLCIVTADHGADPTWSGTDHTRENVPVLAYEPGAAAREIGRRNSFADIGATVAKHLGVAPPVSGTAWN